MEFIESGFVILDKEELIEEERANFPWNNEDDDDGGWRPSPNIDKPDP